MEIKNINIYNSYRAILGIRNSYKSKDKSDSEQFPYHENKIGGWISYNHALLGEKDTELIRKLLKRNDEYGHQERKFLRQILVAMDVKGTLKFWAQFDTYKNATVRQSESTMHCISKGFLEQEDFERPIKVSQIKYLNKLILKYNDKSRQEEVIADISAKIATGQYGRVMHMQVLNEPDFATHKYKLERFELRQKKLFELIDANLPGGYILESHWTGNYENLRNIFHGRKYHKMYWWREFNSYVEKLPYFDLMLKGEK